MSANLSEEEMRRALFGECSDRPPVKAGVAPSSKTKKHSSSITRKIRVTLHVSNIFEGEVTVVTFESPTLSVLAAELDAKKQFQKKYRFVDVVAVERV
ncbi:TPA: hypothetical protein ACG5DM_002408 [Pseudomonas putida]